MVSGIESTYSSLREENQKVRVQAEKVIARAAFVMAFADAVTKGDGDQFLRSIEAGPFYELFVVPRFGGKASF